MPYATQADLVARFGADELAQLTDRVNAPATTIDSNVVAQAIADAAGKIDSYLAARVSLPLTTVPTSLVQVACDIARYNLYADRATEQVTARYEEAVAWLKDIARGVATLGVDASNQPPASVGGVTISANSRVFGAGTLADYAQ